MGDSLFAARKLTPEENRKTRLFCAAATASILFGIPLVLCVAYKLGDFGSIGPWVLVVGVFEMAAFPILALLAAEGLTTRRVLNPIVLVAAFVAGLAIGAIGMNVFIGFTMLFGLFDYSLM
jgi:hypothetical protein